MGKLKEKELEEKLKTEAEVHLIVRTKDDPKRYVGRLEEMGVKVRRTFALIRALAITGKGMDCLALAEEPWVESIEEDKEVRAL